MIKLQNTWIAEVVIYKSFRFACKELEFGCASILIKFLLLMTEVPVQFPETEGINTFMIDCTPAWAIRSYLHKLHWQFSLGIILVFPTLHCHNILLTPSFLCFSQEVAAHMWEKAYVFIVSLRLFCSPMLPITVFQTKQKAAIKSIMHSSKYLILLPLLSWA